MMATFRRAEPPTVDGIPAELTDDEHPLWSDWPAYRAYMLEHGFAMDVRDRLRRADDAGPVGLSPRLRRQAAVKGWALTVGIVKDDHPKLPDLPRLRGMGLL